MAITKSGIIKRRATMIAKYGSEDAYKQAMRQIGSIGGSTKTELTKTRGFYKYPDLASNHGKARKKG